MRYVRWPYLNIHRGVSQLWPPCAICHSETVQIEKSQYYRSACYKSKSEKSCDGDYRATIEPINLYAGLMYSKFQEARIEFYRWVKFIHSLNSDTHTLRIQYEYTQKQCVGVAIEGFDIWYMDLITYIGQIAHRNMRRTKRISWYIIPVTDPRTDTSWPLVGADG